MRCRTARRRLSDALDGALPPAKKSRLEAHLETCPACRANQAGLERIQAASRLPDVPAGHWVGLERRLDARLTAAEADRASARGPFAARRRWALAAAAAAVLAGLALWYVLIGPGAASPETWYAYEDVLGPLVDEAEASPELAAWVDKEISASVAETLPAAEGESAVFPADDPLFWAGLSDEELRAIVGALEEESGQGGPK